MGRCYHAAENVLLISFQKQRTPRGYGAQAEIFVLIESSVYGGNFFFFSVQSQVVSRALVTTFYKVRPLGYCLELLA